MEKLKQYKYVILIVLVVLGFAFYWYEIKPKQIRKECDKYASEMVNYDLRVNETSQSYTGLMYDSQKESEKYYKSCLRERGL